MVNIYVCYTVEKGKISTKTDSFFDSPEEAIQFIKTCAGDSAQNAENHDCKFDLHGTGHCDNPSHNQ